jgi:hypothetical protein
MASNSGRWDPAECDWGLTVRCSFRFDQARRVLERDDQLAHELVERLLSLSGGIPADVAQMSCSFLTSTLTADMNDGWTGDRVKRGDIGTPEIAN